MRGCKITIEHVRRKEARVVYRNGYYEAEWSPRGTQLEMAELEDSLKDASDQQAEADS